MHGIAVQLPDTPAASMPMLQTGHITPSDGELQLAVPLSFHDRAQIFPGHHISDLVTSSLYTAICLGILIVLTL